VVANLWLNGDMTVGARSEVMRSVTKLEVAMVLDTTGSMAGSKMTNLKAASIDFIDQMAAAAARSTETDPVKIGIVPFSSAVRLGSTTSEISTYKAANWMDAAGNAPASKEIFWTSGSNYGATVNRFTLFDNMGATWAGCVESREAPYDVQDTAPSAGAPATLFTPYFWPDEADTDSNAVNQYADDKKGGSGNAASWNQEKRQGNITKYTKNNVSISSSQGPNLGCSMQSVTRLSTNWADLKSKINGMTAVGETHIPLGMMWGWHVVSPNAPFGDGVPYSTPKTTKVVILMTDGDNTWFNSSSVNGTKYAGYAYHWQDRAGTTSSNANTRANRLNSRLTTLCNNMRAAGIVVYTVRVEVKSGSSSLLQNCATTPDKFYDVQSASNLTAVFSAIAGSIQNLRIAA